MKEDFVQSNLSMSIADYGKVIQERNDKEVHSTNAKKYYYETYK